MEFIMNKEILEKAIIDLFQVERFYAEIVLQMNKFITHSVPTAGVNVKDGINLYINPDFFERLTPEARVGILIHECQHLLNDHIFRAKELFPDVYTNKPSKRYYEDIEEAVEDVISKQKHQVLNISMDCAINSLNPRIPTKFEVFDEEKKEWTETGPVLPEHFDLERRQTFEWYVENLKNNEKAKNANCIDDHSIWADSEEDKELLKEKIRQAINKAAKRTRGAGRMSADDELLVDKLNYKPRDWKSDLKRFVARNSEVYLDTSRKKRNRRYGILFPGTVKFEKLHIAAMIDTSGSVPDEALAQFMAEIGSIAKNNVKVTIIIADSEVKDVFDFDPKKPIKMKGRGGTAYGPALEKGEELQIDGCIYFGDGDCADVPEKPSYPVLWALYGESDKPTDFGSVTRVTIKTK